MKSHAVILFSTLVYLALTLVSTKAVGQKHLAPEDGANGIPWAYDRSFVISWKKGQNDDRYQYLITDNPLCYYGCSGDTRTGVVSDTFAISFNSKKEKWYYWITRTISKGDTSRWSGRSSFYANEIERGADLVKIWPNPLPRDRSLQFEADWNVNQRVQKVRVEVFDMQGRKILDKWMTRQPGVRFQYFEMNNSELSGGMNIISMTAFDEMGILRNQSKRKFLIE